jgi:zinc protease
MKKFLLFLISFLMGGMIISQDMMYTPDEPVPLDPAVLYGKLDNGFTYYIRENAKPEMRAEFYLLVSAGAVLEDDDQDGLAHFCEHMAFNGTKNFEKHEIINYLQSIGMKFGPEINAFTSQDVTTYMLQKVPMEDPSDLDTALMILRDWAQNVSFEDEEIDAERGVIHEEWRTRRGAMFRMMNEANKVILAGSKYAERDVIGDIEIIDNAPYETLRDFYHSWYRPNLQAIVAVGDFDKDFILEKVTTLFGDMENPANQKVKESFPVPDHAEIKVAIQTDPEAQYPILQLVYKHDPKEKKNNMEYYRQAMVQNLFNSMINKRLNELLQSNDPPFVYGFASYNELVKTKDAYMSFAVCKADGMDRSLKALLAENARVKEYGFTETELERTKAEFISNVEKQYAERNDMESDSYVWQYYSHFFDNEPAPGIEYDHDFMKSFLPGITLDEVNELAKKWIRDENMAVVYMLPERDDMEIPSEEHVRSVLAEMQNAEVDPWVDRTKDLPLIAVEPEPGEVVKEKKDKKLETVTWTLSNGIRVVIKETDFKSDEIMMSAYSVGGSSIYDLADLVSAQQTIPVIMESGLGVFDKVELEKKLSGKIVSVSPVISGTYEGFSGYCSPRDFETMLQLVYLYFNEPRRDDDAFNGYIKRMKAVYENRSLNPSSALWDTAAVTMANYHPRVRPMTAEMLDEANPDRVELIYRERFDDPGSFTFYFVGNVDPEKVKPVVEKYLGGLPRIVKSESWVDNGIRPPAGKIEKEVMRQMEVPKATVYINFSGVYDYDDNMARLNLATLCDILDVRYTETIREEQGGTYGVAVNPVQVHYPYENYQVMVFFDCDPENVGKLTDIAYEEIEKLKKSGPLVKDLNGVKENLLKTYDENVEKNTYWLNMLKRFDFDGLDPSYHLKYGDMVDKLTVEGLKKAASEFFGDNVVEVVLMPVNIEDNISNPVKEN